MADSTTTGEAAAIGLRPGFTAGDRERDPALQVCTIHRSVKDEEKILLANQLRQVREMESIPAPVSVRRFRRKRRPKWVSGTIFKIQFH
jgi:hypothetical protein